MIRAGAVRRQRRRLRPPATGCGIIELPMEEQQAEQAPRRVSVIIVSFNNAAALRRCLATLEASADRATFEILVVDNGSVDDCARMDAEFPAIY